MRYKVLCILLVLCLWPMPSPAVTRDTFLVRTTQDLTELCTAPETDPLHAAAIGFCFGYILGAHHYYVSEQSGPDAKPMFCMPEPQPTRQQAVQMFVAWAKQNSQYMGERPVDSLMRFATGQWPCPTARPTGGAAGKTPGTKK